eukprot:scaffold71_cov247-Pinguiococcus_pyrenoidosus.AAC.8
MARSRREEARLRRKRDARVTEGSESTMAKGGEKITRIVADSPYFAKLDSTFERSLWIRAPKVSKIVRPVEKFSAL